MKVAMKITDRAIIARTFNIGRDSPSFQVSSVKPTGTARIEAPISTWRISFVENTGMMGWTTFASTPFFFSIFLKS